MANLYGCRFPYHMYERTPISPPGTPIQRAWHHAERWTERCVKHNELVNPIVWVHCDDEQVWAEVLA